MKNKIIDLYKPFLSSEEKKNLTKCIDRNEVAIGFFLKKLSSNINKITGSKYSVPLQNCTTALYLSLKLLGVKPDHEVLVPTITFIASVNAVSYCGAKPVFMDSDINGNIDLSKTIEFINKETYFKNGKTFNKKTKKIISSIIIVHVFGNAVDITREIKNFLKIKNIKILEDAAESLGSYQINRKKKIHTGTIGDLGCISFNGNKIITAGGGGIILTNKFSYFKKINYLINQAKSNNIEFIHNEIGYNFRISNIHAAIANAQLKNFSKILKLKKNIFHNYLKIISRVDGLSIMKPPENSLSNHWLNILKINENSKFKREELLIKLNNKNIRARPVWIPNHLQKPYKKCQSYKIRNAYVFYNSSICLPSSPDINLTDIKKIYNIIK